MRIISIDSLEGNYQQLDGGAMFGNVPKAVWSRWMPANENNCIPLACRSLLLTLNDDRHILFETGIGTFFEPSLRKRFGILQSEHCLLESLEKKGLSDKDIDIVILSHLHFDHAGGLLSSWHEHEPYQLLFPNAEYWVSQEQWHRACHPHARDKASYIPELHDLLKNSGRLHLINEEDEHPLQSLISFTFSNGHTPGLMLSHIATDAGPLVFCSDLIPGKPWVHLPITMGYDRYPELLINEKKGLLEGLLYKEGYLFFTHDPDTPVGKLYKDKNGKYYVQEQNLQKLLNNQ